MTSRSRLPSLARPASWLARSLVTLLYYPSPGLPCPSTPCYPVHARYPAPSTASVRLVMHLPAHDQPAPWLAVLVTSLVAGFPLDFPGSKTTLPYLLPCPGLPCPVYYPVLLLRASAGFPD